MRPLSARIFSGLLFGAALATGYLGLSAQGFLIPALVLAGLAGLMWLGRGRDVVVAVLTLNVASELVSNAVLLLGDGLGIMKLDIAGAALLAHIVAGGPLLLPIAIPALIMLRASPQLAGWLARTSAARA